MCPQRTTRLPQSVQLLVSKPQYTHVTRCGHGHPGSCMQAPTILATAAITDVHMIVAGHHPGIAASVGKGGGGGGTRQDRQDAVPAQPSDCEGWGASGIHLLIARTAAASRTAAWNMVLSPACTSPRHELTTPLECSRQPARRSMCCLLHKAALKLVQPVSLAPDCRQHSIYSVSQQTTRILIEPQTARYCRTNTFAIVCFSHPTPSAWSKLQGEYATAAYTHKVIWHAAKPLAKNENKAQQPFKCRSAQKCSVTLGSEPSIATRVESQMLCILPTI